MALISKKCAICTKAYHKVVSPYGVFHMPTANSERFKSIWLHRECASVGMNKLQLFAGDTFAMGSSMLTEFCEWEWSE